MDTSFTPRHSTEQVRGISRLRCSANKKALAREEAKYEASKDAYLAKAAANDRSYLQSELKVFEPASPVG
ncbi:MAG: hypothetical protein B7X90_13410 [Novosphingobium sp. 17-62-19]|nr:MAG: hypothetical protein B7X90_13410 [Novosphingobium sp. 17-62-19]